MKINETIISEDEKHVFFWDETGDAQMQVHKVFPGIEVVYNSVHMDKCSLAVPIEGRVIEIQHCREGRFEQHFNDEFFYMMPGDLSVAIRERMEKEVSFPMRHYHGLTIAIHIDKAPRCFSCFLKDVNVKPLNVAQRLCGDKKRFVVRNKEYIEHIFSEIYSVPDSYKKGYLKIKILELLLVLSGIAPEEDEVSKISVSKTQVELAKRISEYLKYRTDENINVSDLAKQFHVSKTHLQNVFNSVYGTSVFNYMRIQKMQLAALKLIHTEMPILEIAGEFGYSNPSKFAAAFKEIMGELPLEYRKGHSIN